MQASNISYNVDELFFSDLKKYNSTNFKMIYKADVSEESATVFKSFSSVVTRYFIFVEKHPEISEQDLRMLYYRLSIDLIAQYFSEFPDTCPDNLMPFQDALKQYVDSRK